MKDATSPNAYYALLANALNVAGYEVEPDDYEVIDAILAAANMVLEVRSPSQK